MVAFATQVKRRRGTTAQNDAFTGAEGEIVVDTEKHTLRVHDGATLGGFEMARQADLNDKAATSYVDTQLLSKANTDLSNVPDNYDYVVESQMPTADNGYTWYRKYKSGWVEQGGIDSTGAGTKTITLPIVMKDNNYIILTATESGTSTHNATVYGRTTTSFTASKSNTVCFWQVSGVSE